MMEGLPTADEGSSPVGDEGSSPVADEIRTLCVEFIRDFGDNDQSVTLAFVDQHGHEQHRAQLGNRDKDFSQLRLGGPELPWKTSQETRVGSTWIVRGEQTGNILEQIVVEAAPLVQHHSVTAGSWRNLTLGEAGTDEEDADDDLNGPSDPVEWDLEERPSISVGPLVQSAFDVVEARYDAACAAAAATGLLTEAELDALTDAVARLDCFSQREDLMSSQLARLSSGEQAAASRLVLTSLPAEILVIVLGHLQASVADPARLNGRAVRIHGLQSRPQLNGRVLIAGAFDAVAGRVAVALPCGKRVSLRRLNLRPLAESGDARALARCSLSCRTMHQCADEAARVHAKALGLDLSIARCPQRFFQQQRHAVRALHARLSSLPRSIKLTDEDDGVRVVSRLRAELRPFGPVLCEASMLVLPRLESALGLGKSVSQSVSQ